MTTPIFLLSLPRAGSTLVQRVLAAHPEVATASEPWLLLPFFYARRTGGIRGEYGHNPLHRGISDFLAALPDGEAAYSQAVAEFARSLYVKAAGGRRYFLDKTPRYHLIAEDLVKAFPQARFVILWRNPLAVAASVVESFCAGRLKVGDYLIDLEQGPANLARLQRQHGERICAIAYERLVTGEEDEWRRLFAHLDLAFDPTLLERFSQVELNGLMGDQTGRVRYKALSSEPLDKWRATLSGIVRRRWAAGLLRKIGQPDLEAMGHDLGRLLADLRSLPMQPQRTPRDAWDLAWSRIKNRGKRRILGSGA